MKTSSKNRTFCKEAIGCFKEVKFLELTINKKLTRNAYLGKVKEKVAFVYMGMPKPIKKTGLLASTGYMDLLVTWNGVLKT